MFKRDKVNHERSFSLKINNWEPALVPERRTCSASVHCTSGAFRSCNRAGDRTCQSKRKMVRCHNTFQRRFISPQGDPQPWVLRPFHLYWRWLLRKPAKRVWMRSKPSPCWRSCRRAARRCRITGTHFCGAWMIPARPCKELPISPSPWSTGNPSAAAIFSRDLLPSVVVWL